MSVLPRCMLLYHKCAWCLRMSEEHIGFPRTRAMDGCEPPSWS